MLVLGVEELVVKVLLCLSWMRSSCCRSAFILPALRRDPTSIRKSGFFRPPLLTALAPLDTFLMLPVLLTLSLELDFSSGVAGSGRRTKVLVGKELSWIKLFAL